MQAEDLLRDLSKPKIKKIARFFGLKTHNLTKMDSNQLVDAVLPGYTTEAIRQHLAELSNMEIKLLDYLCLFTDADSDGAVRRDVAFSYGASRDQKHVIDALISKGFVFTKKYYWDDILLVPDEIAAHIFNREVNKVAGSSNARRTADGEVRVRENYGLAAHHDMLHILSTIAHEKVTVTRQGRIYKRAMKKIDEGCRLQEDQFAGVVRFSDHYKNIIFWQDYLMDAGLMTIKSFVACVQMPTVSAFLHVPYEQWSNSLFTFYLKELLKSADEIRSLPVNFLYEVFLRFGSEWELKRSITDVIEKWTKKWNIFSDDRIMDDLFFHPLLLFGLIETGTDAQNREVWRWTDSGKAVMHSLSGEKQAGAVDALTDDIYVQPNLEIMVPENILPAIRWRIETFAEMKKSDAVLIYEWSGQRIEQAIEAGWTLEKILEFIRKYSKNPIPDNVVRTLGDWTENYGKAKLWDVLVFEISDPAIASMVRNQKKIQSLIVASFSDTAHVIRRKDEPKLRAAMQALGYPILQSISTPDAPGERKRVATDVGAEEINRKSYAPGTYPDAFNKEVLRDSRLVLAEVDPEALEDGYF